MAVSRSSINSFARTFRQGDDTSSLWTPRPPVWSLQQGTIMSVDSGNNVAHVALNDGSGEVALGVRYLHTYSPDNLPQSDDLAWGHYNGKVMLLLGRQVVPNGPVRLS